MSLLPHPNRNVKGLAGDEWPQLTVGPLCCAPGCSRFVDHPHHLWRRSALGGPFPWVRLWDGSTVQNVVGICWQHHSRISDDLDRITLEEDGRFLYRDQSNVALGPIKPQPQTLGKNAYPTVSEAARAPGRCPTCNMTLRPSRDDTGEREPSRNRVSWSVTVPKDDREDGAEHLDVLLEAARRVMDARGWSYGPERKVRYYVLSAALAMFVQHADALVSE